MARISLGNSPILRYEDVSDDTNVFWGIENGMLIVRVPIKKETNVEDSPAYTETPNKENPKQKQIRGIKRKKDVPNSVNRAISEARERYYYNMKKVQQWQVLGITLTYSKENKTKDYKKVTKNFGDFIAAIRERYTKEFGYIDYITMKELHSDGTFHIHALLIAKSTTIPLDIPKVSERRSVRRGIKNIWAKGRVSIKLGENMKNPISYLTPHKTSSTNDYAKKMNKKYERLNLIPSKCKIFNYSDGIKKKPKGSMKNGQLKEIVKGLPQMIAHKKYQQFYSIMYDRKISMPFMEFAFDLDQLSEIEQEIIINNMKAL